MTDDVARHLAHVADDQPMMQRTHLSTWHGISTDPLTTRANLALIHQDAHQDQHLLSRSLELEDARSGRMALGIAIIATAFIGGVFAGLALAGLFF